MLQSKRLGLVSILDAWTFLPQRRGQSADAWTKFRNSLEQPKHNQRVNEDQQRAQERFRLYWRKHQPVKNEPSEQTRLSSRLRFNNVCEPSDQASAQTEFHSPTFRWLSRFAFDGTVVPKHLSQHEFPAGDVLGHTPRATGRRRTEEDKRRVEAVLRTPIPRLTEYITSEMMDRIMKSPFNQPDEDVLVVRSWQHRTRGQNLLECFRLLSRLIRNVASEIVYREQRIAADEMMYREEGTYDDPETVFLSEAESEAMAWNVKRPFNFQLKHLRKLKEQELSKARLSLKSEKSKNTNDCY